MGIANENLTKEARKRFFTTIIDISETRTQAHAFVDNDCATKVNKITFVYSVASDTGTVEAIEVGTAADSDHYFTGNPANSKAIGTVETKTVLNPTDLLPAGTALIVQKASADSEDNTAEVTVVVELETIDRIRSL